MTSKTYICDYCEEYKGSKDEVIVHEKNCPSKDKHLTVEVMDDHEALSQRALDILLARINEFEPTEIHQFFVLVLPTGNTPKKLYELLVKAYQEGKVSLENVVMFNMDEYVGLKPDNPDSYYHYMQKHLLNFGLNFGDTHLYRGDAEKPEQEAQSREEQLANHGQIDLALGGVGINGHIAFNEPGSSAKSRTRVVKLEESTIQTNFGAAASGTTPSQAITIGMGNIMAAKEVLILASGDSKRKAVQSAIEGPYSKSSPITLLRAHDNAKLLVDKKAYELVNGKHVSH